MFEYLSLDVTLEFHDFSFLNPDAANTRVAESAHVLLFCGFGGGTSYYTTTVLPALGAHRTDLSSLVRTKVQYGQLLWIGVCGGAMCAGRQYWPSMPSQLGLDVFNGVNVLYDGATGVGDIGPSKTNTSSFHMASSIGMAVWFKPGGSLSSSFVVSKNGAWHGPKHDFAEDNAAKLSEAVNHLSNVWFPYADDEGNVWYHRLDGTVYIKGSLFNAN